MNIEPIETFLRLNSNNETLIELISILKIEGLDENYVKLTVLNTKIAIDTYSTRAKVNSEINNENAAKLGYKDLIDNLKSHKAEELLVVSIPTNNCSFSVFANLEMTKLLGVIKSSSYSLEKAKELKLVYDKLNLH